MDTTGIKLLFLCTSLALSAVNGQFPLQNSSSEVAGSSQCEPLTMSFCAGRVAYDSTIYPNMIGMVSQADANNAAASFAPLAQLGCAKMADFICMLFAPPCVQAGDVSVPVPPCRHSCEEAKSECEPVLQAAGVTWPEQFECTLYPEITSDSVRCAESEMKVLETLAPAEPEAPQLCYEVTVPECRQLGFTHTSFPNIFGHTTPVEMGQDMQALSQIVVSQCSADVLPLICAAYLPKCDPATGRVTKPCKETCRRVFKDCKDAMKELPGGKLDLFACRNYESKKTEGACIEDIRAPAPPVIMNISRTAVSQAQVFLQQPEIASVTVSGLEITYFNDQGDDEGTRVIDLAEIATIDLMTQSQYTILARAFNDWGMSPYADANIPEYTAGYGHCEPITIAMCADFKYDQAQFPNILQHQTQADADLEITQFLPLVNSQCSLDLLPFLCGLYAPRCTATPSPQGIVPPCRELCQSARDGCEPLMNKFGFSWPDSMDCAMLPSSADVGRMCFNNNDLILQPAVNGRGTVETDLGSPVIAYCSSSSSASRPEWFSPEGETVTKMSSDMAPTSMHVFSEPIGEHTAALHIRPLSSDNEGVYTCNLEMESQPMDISATRTCVASDSYICRQMPYTDSQYPNLIGHVSPTEAEIASYQFLPFLSAGCSPVNLPLFVCSLYHPSCGDAIVPPCTELCMAVMTECSVFILGTQWAWPDHAQCNLFPSANDVAPGACVPAISVQPEPEPTPEVVIDPETTPEPGPEPGPEPEPEPEVVATTPAAAPMQNLTQPMPAQPDATDIVPFQLLPRSYAVRDRGMIQMFRGWVDVQGQGAPNDFCRVVRTDGKAFLSCLLAGAEEDDLFAYTSPDPSVEWFDPGYSNTWYMRDEDNDGRDDYCRCIGSVPSTVVACMKAGETGFEGPEHDFKPDNAPEECLYYQADPFFGYP